jgi:uncharacterized protein with GYD domain
MGGSHADIHLFARLDRAGHQTVKDSPKRAKAARKIAEKVGVDIKQVYMTSGDDDVLVILETEKGDNVAKFALALSARATCAPRRFGLGAKRR